MVHRSLLLVAALILWVSIGTCVATLAGTLEMGLGRDTEYARWLERNSNNEGRRRSLITVGGVEESIIAPINKDNSPPGGVTLFSRNNENFVPTIVVNCNRGENNSDYTNVQDAINYLQGKTYPPGSRAIIFLRKCTYSEKVKIPSYLPRITLKGEDVFDVVMAWNDTASTIAEDDSKMIRPRGTFNSYSFAVENDYFILESITIINTAPEPSRSSNNLQAVAYRITGSFAAHFNCRFFGWQDTLYDHRGIHFFYNCYIQGSVDFIFGNGQTIYDNCLVVSANPGAITAQKRDSPDNTTGFVIIRSIVRSNIPTRLGRTWGNFSRVIYADTYLEGLEADAWDIFGAGTEYRREQAFYAEYKNYGPAAVTVPRNNWTKILTDDQAAPFVTGYNFIGASSWLTSFPSQKPVTFTAPPGPPQASLSPPPPATTPPPPPTTLSPPPSPSPPPNTPPPPPKTPPPPPITPPPPPNTLSPPPNTPPPPPTTPSPPPKTTPPPPKIPSPPPITPSPPPKSPSPPPKTPPPPPKIPTPPPKTPSPPPKSPPPPPPAAPKPPPPKSSASPPPPPPKAPPKSPPPPPPKASSIPPPCHASPSSPPSKSLSPWSPPLKCPPPIRSPSPPPPRPLRRPPPQKRKRPPPPSRRRRRPPPPRRRRRRPPPPNRHRRRPPPPKKHRRPSPKRGYRQNVGDRHAHL